jgi:hypothetical protein
MHQITCGETLKRSEVLSLDIEDFLNKSISNYNSLKEINVLSENGLMLNNSGMNYINIVEDNKSFSHLKAIITKEYYDCEKVYPFLGELFLDIIFNNKNYLNLKSFFFTKNNINNFIKNETNQALKEIIKIFIKNCSIEYSISIQESNTSETIVEKNNIINFKNNIDYSFYNGNKINVFYDYEFCIIDGYIESIGEIHHLLQKSNDENNKTFVLFCYGMSNDVKNTIYLNNKRKKTRVFPISFEVNEENLNILNDIAILHNSEIITSDKGQTISQAIRKKLKSGNRLSVDVNNKTFAIQPVCNNQALKQHISFLEKRMNKSTNKKNSSLIKNRIKSLSLKNINIFVSPILAKDYNFLKKMDYTFNFFSNSNKKFIKIKKNNTYYYFPKKFIVYIKNKSDSLKNIFENIDKVIQEVD